MIAYFNKDLLFLEFASPKEAKWVIGVRETKFQRRSLATGVESRLGVCEAQRFK